MANLKMPSDAQLQVMYKITVLIAKNFKDRSDKVWKNKSLPVMIFSALMVIGMLVTLVYYIMTSSIAPLMIYIACAIPILAYGLTQASKNLQKVNEEFDQYNESMKRLLAVLMNSSAEATDDVTVALGAAIAAVTTVVPESMDNVTFGDLRKMAEFKKAVVLAENLKSISTAIEDLNKEGFDVESILSSLDLDDYEAEDLYEGESSLLDALMGQAKSPDTDVSDVTGDSKKDTEKSSESSDEKDDGNNSNSHIIPSDDDTYEDLSIVV